MKNTPFTRIWITGASDGIGKALAYAFATAGVRVVLSGRDEKKLEEVQKECYQRWNKRQEREGAITIERFDCTNIQESIGVASKLADTIDLAIFCAGISQRRLSFEMTQAQDSIIHSVNFVSPVECTKMLVKKWQGTMSQRKIVAVSSIASRIPVPYRAMYAASKTALEHYFRTLGNELAMNAISNISVAIVVPGFVHTDISKKALAGEEKLWNKMDKNQLHAISADIAARQIIKSLVSNTFVTYIGMNVRLRIIVFLCKHMPHLANRILAKVSTTE